MYKNIQPGLLSEKQDPKTIAWGLLGVGTTMILIGTLAGAPAAVDEAVGSTVGESTSTGADTWGVVVLTGVACDIASIPFFISASKNRRLSGEVHINNQKMYLLQRNYVSVKYVPGVTVKINMGK